MRCTLACVPASLAAMGFRAAFVLALAVGSGAGCQFAPSGDGGGGDDDGGGPDGGDDAAATDAASAGDAAVLPIDAAPPIDARPSCPADYAFGFGGSRYVRRAGPAGISDARNDCHNDLPGRTGLATFENPSDLDPVVASAGALGGDQLWVGARCNFTTFGCEGPTSWTWDSGAAIAGSLWVAGEPDNAFTELNALTLRSGGDWLLASTGDLFVTHPYVCECAE